MEVDKSTPVLSVKSLHKSYLSGESELEVLCGVSFELFAGQTLAIVGPSGSGKSTLLAIAAGLERPSSGFVEISGNNLDALNEDQTALLRRKRVGFVFQDFQLFPSLTALENVSLPLELSGELRSAKNKSKELLTRVGLAERLSHYPSQLSGGEQQRVAIARACIHQPELLFADEPTGNLDADSSESVSNLLFQLSQGAFLQNAEQAPPALLIVTHDLSLANKCQQKLFLKRGRVVED